MNDDQKFWIAVWKLVASCFCVLTLSITGCVANNKRVIEALVSAGASPTEAYCAANSDMDRASASICTAVLFAPENMRKPK